MHGNKIQISVEIARKEAQLIMLKSSESTQNKKAEKLRDSLNMIKNLYKNHFEVFNSRYAYDISQGYGINLVSAQELGNKVSVYLKGNKLNKCNEAYENEISETVKQLKLCEDIITGLKRTIANTEDEIRNLKRELLS